MFEFPKNLYTDVRIEDVFETNILYTLGKLEQSQLRKYKAAFIRIFDGDKWYYSSLSDTNLIQEEINKLSKMAKPNQNINEDPMVKNFEVNKGTYLKFKENNVKDLPKEEKDSFLKSIFNSVKDKKTIKLWKASYIDCRKDLEFYSSKGADIKYDTQRVGINYGFNMAQKEKKFSEIFSECFNSFDEIKSCKDKFKIFIDKCEDFLINSKKIVPGNYTVILSPKVSGVFAHECFGHKSESDSMIGDKILKKEWKLGKKIASDIVSIVDSGFKKGNGFIPFDDEGTKTKETYLIKNGILTGRLHSIFTATKLDEKATGNARAVNYEFEPIVRMTSTYILPGNKTKEELFKEVKDGFYIETFKHGSGMSTFTIAPALAYRIKDGKIIEPVDIAVISGSVFKTLSEIDGLSNELEIYSPAAGGCGKYEQSPLPVGFGGPYVKIKNMNVQ